MIGSQRRQKSEYSGALNKLQLCNLSGAFNHAPPNLLATADKQA